MGRHAPMPALSSNAAGYLDPLGGPASRRPQTEDPAAGSSGSTGRRQSTENNTAPAGSFSSGGGGAKAPTSGVNDPLSNLASTLPRPAHSAGEVASAPIPPKAPAAAPAPSSAL